MIDINHLRAFVEVAEAGSFRVAAERLRVSQPTLTTRIKQFEDLTGVILFDRTSRTVQLTQAGQEFLPMAVQLINDFQMYLKGVSDFAHRRRGHVRLAALYSIATVLLPDIVRDFIQDHPDISIELRDDASNEVSERVLRGEVDFGFGERQQDQPDLEYRLLFRDRLVVAFREDSPLARHDEIGLDVLARERFIGFGRLTGPGRYIARQSNMPESIEFPGLVVWNTPTLEALLMSGAGVSIVPALAVAHWYRQGIAWRPLAGTDFVREVFFIRRRGRTMSPAAKLLQGLIISRISAQTDGDHMIVLPGREPSPQRTARPEPDPPGPK